MLTAFKEVDTFMSQALLHHLVNIMSAHNREFLLLNFSGSGNDSVKNLQTP